VHVDLAFLGPVRHRPPRAREARTEFQPLRTPARLPELGLGETDEGPSFLIVGNRRMRTRLIDGEIWRAVGRDAWDQPGPRSPEAATFVAWLQGEPEGRSLDRGEVANLFAGTPLVARLDRFGSLARPRGERPGPRSTPLADWRERARSAAVEFLAREVAIVGGIPMTRMRGPLAYFLTEANSFRIARWPGARARDADEARGIFLRVDRVASMARHLYLAYGRGYGAWAERDLDGITFLRDDDLALTAAGGVHLLAAEIMALPGRHPCPEELARRALDLSALAAIGFLPEEVPAAYTLIEQACAWHRRGPSRPPLWVEHFDAYARHVAAPILSAASDLSTDARNLATLAP